MKQMQKDIFQLMIKVIFIFFNSWSSILKCCQLSFDNNKRILNILQKQELIQTMFIVF